MLLHKIINHFIVFALSCLFFIPFSLKAQTHEIFLKAKDGRNGSEVKATFKVKSTISGIEIPVVQQVGQQSIKVELTDRIQLTVSAPGFYTNEQLIQLDDSFETENLLLTTLEQRPFSKLGVLVVDAKTSQPIEAEVQIFLKNKLKGTYQTKASKQPTEVHLYEPGEYKLVAKTDGYTPTEEVEKYEVTTPPITYTKALTVSKENEQVMVQVLEKGTSKPIQLVRINYVNDGLISTSKEAEKGQFSLDMSQPSTAELHIMADGYFSTKKLTASITQDAKIFLSPLPTYTITVREAQTNKPLAAKLEITPKNGTSTFISVAEGQKGSYLPKSDGEILIKTSVEGYMPYAIYHTQIEGKPNLDVVLDKSTRNYRVVASAEGKRNITSATLKVYDMSKQEVLNKTSTNGQFDISLTKDKAYRFSIAADGFELGDKTVIAAENELIEISLVRKKSIYKLTVLDAYTKLPISKAQIVGTLNGLRFEDETNGSGVYELEKFPEEDMAITVDASNYQPEKHLIISTSPKEIQILLSKSFVEVALEVVNATDGSALPGATVKVMNLTTNKPLQPLDGKPSTYAFNTQHQFAVEASLADFDVMQLTLDGKEMLTTNSTTKPIRLTPRATVTHVFEVVESGTTNKLNATQFEVVNDEGMTYAPNRSNNVWQVVVKNKVPYTVKVSAAGMESATYKVSDFTKFNHSIALKKLDQTEVVFEAFDEILKSSVPAKFSLVEDTKITDISPTINAARATVKLLTGKSYKIRASAPDYRDVEKLVEWPIEPQQVVRVNFKKKSYPVTIQIRNMDNKFLAETPTLQAASANIAQIPVVFLKDKSAFTLDFPTDTDLTLKFAAEGFEPRTETLTFADVAAAGLVKTYNLKEIPKKEPEKVVTSPTPPPTAPKPIEKPVEPVKQPEVKIEAPTPVVAKPQPTVFEINALPLVDLPPTTEAMLASFLGESAKQKKFVLNRVYFDQSSPVMQEASNAQLNQVLAALKKNEKLVIMLVGHTDDTGDKRQNQYLSEFRAKVVSNYLYNNGIAANRISTKGEGPAYPIAPNDTEENKAKNRRVELIIMAND